MRTLYLAIASLFISFYAFSQTPYASYPLDGNAMDASGNNLHGTIVGNPSAAQNRYNQNGTSLDFDGVNDYITLPSSFDLPTRSVIVWFNASQIGSANGYNVVYSSDGPHLVYGLTNITTYTDNTFGDIIRLNSGGEVFNASINPNQWYQVAIVRTPSLVKFYLNGVMVFSQNNPTALTSGNGSASTAIVGADRGYLAKFFGRIDDLSVYNTTVTDDMIANNYTSLKDIHVVEDNLTVFASSGDVMCNFDSEESISVVKSVRLVDITGKVLTERNEAFSGKLNDNKLSSGIYFVSVELEGTNKIISKKVMIVE